MKKTATPSRNRSQCGQVLGLGKGVGPSGQRDEHITKKLA